MNSKFYTMHEVAELLGCNYQTVWRKVKAGAIPAIKNGRVVRIPKSFLDAKVEEAGK